MFACVYIDLPATGEMKKKIAKMSDFIHNLARGRMATACFLPLPCQRKIAEKKGKAQLKRRSFHVPNLINTYLGQPK